MVSALFRPFKSKGVLWTYVSGFEETELSQIGKSWCDTKPTLPARLPAAPASSGTATSLQSPWGLMLSVAAGRG